MRHIWPQRGLWRHPDFLHLWAAQSISAVGSRITRTVLPLYAILSIDASPNQVALLAALSTAPGFIVGLSLGGTVDRRSKRRLLIGADLLRAAILLVVPAAAWFGVVSIGQLYAVAAIAGAATALFQIADNSYLPVLVRRDQLIDGNAKLHATDSFAEVTGPGLGGILMQLLGAPGAIALDAISYLTSAGLLARIRRVEDSPEPEGDPPSPLTDVRTGLRAGFGSPVTRPLYLLAANEAFFGGFFYALYYLFCTQVIGLGGAAIGLIISVGGVGALLGSWGAARSEGALPIGRALLVGTALAAITALMLPAAGWAAGPLIALALLIGHQLFADGFSIFSNVLALSLRQAALPPAEIGRANAAYHALVSGLTPIGALVAGPLAQATSVEVAVLVGVSGGLLNPLIVALSGLHRLEALPEAGDGES